MIDAAETTPAATETRADGAGNSVTVKKAARAAPKKTAAKKPAKKAAKKTKTAKRGGAAVRIADDAVFSLKASAKNPRREGSSKHEQFELMRKHSGKTVGKLVELGVDRGQIRSMIKRGLGFAKAA